MPSSVSPASNASRTTQSMAGLAPKGASSLGTAWVKGCMRVPRPAAGMRAFFMVFVLSRGIYGSKTCAPGAVLQAKLSGRTP